MDNNAEGLQINVPRSAVCLGAHVFGPPGPGRASVSAPRSSFCQSFNTVEEALETELDHALKIETGLIKTSGGHHRGKGRVARIAPAAPERSATNHPAFRCTDVRR
jgi:hypothetical protein